MTGAWEGQVGAAAAALAAIVAGRVWVGARRRSRLLAVARGVTARYARLLSVKQKQLVIHDGYGNYELRPWIEHVDYFIANVVLREARSSGCAVDRLTPSSPGWGALRRTLLATLHADGEAASAPVRDEDVMSGEHYEVLCRNLLQGCGWTVETTPVTGDQGADLVADAGDRRVVIQCKFHSKPVGNKAVQEAYAARGFHAGHHAAVVSNARFTRSARELAQANGVLLLHHDQLADLRDLVRSAAPR